MNSTSSPLDRPASITTIRRLLALELLTTEEARKMERQVRRELPWKLWLDRGLLSLGVVLILAGISYFFAHNWDHITNNDKLGLSAGAVLLILIGATWAGLDHFPGKLLLLAASAFVGVFIAVFEQTYQTGADTYRLLACWALLIFPWVALGRFMPLWLFWLALLNLALECYWLDVPCMDTSDSWIEYRHETISLLTLNGVALLMREFLDTKRISWMDRGCSALILLCAVIILATLETAGEILYTWNNDMFNGHTIISCGFYTALITGLGLFYRRWRYSLPSLAIITLGGCVTLTVLAFRAFIAEINLDHSGIWILMGLIVLAIFGSGVLFLRTQRLSHNQS